MMGMGGSKAAMMGLQAAAPQGQEPVEAEGGSGIEGLIQALQAGQLDPEGQKALAALLLSGGGGAPGGEMGMM